MATQPQLTQTEFPTDGYLHHRSGANTSVAKRNTPDNTDLWFSHEKWNVVSFQHLYFHPAAWALFEILAQKQKAAYFTQLFLLASLF